MSAIDEQVGGDHYKTMKVQPWEALECWLSKEQFQGYLLGSAIAYLARVQTEGVAGKGGATDVGKAIHYLQRWVEVDKEAKEAPARGPTEAEKAEATFNLRCMNVPDLTNGSISHRMSGYWSGRP